MNERASITYKQSKNLSDIFATIDYLDVVRKNTNNLYALAIKERNSLVDYLLTLNEKSPEDYNLMVSPDFTFIEFVQKDKQGDANDSKLSERETV